MRKYYGEAKEPEREFSSTQVNLPRNIARKVQALAGKIPDADLHEDGREDEPHITVKFGLHDALPSARLRNALKGFGTVKATLGKTSLFKNDKQDVIKLDVFSPDLHRLNKIIKEHAEHTDTYPTYVPHATIAYTKKGRGEKHSGDKSVFGTKVEFDHIVFSAKDRTKHKIPLK